MNVPRNAVFVFSKMSRLGTKIRRHCIDQRSIGDYIQDGYKLVGVYENKKAGKSVYRPIFRTFEESKLRDNSRKARLSQRRLSVSEVLTDTDISHRRNIALVQEAKRLVKEYGIDKITAIKMVRKNDRGRY